MQGSSAPPAALTAAVTMGRTSIVLSPYTFSEAAEITGRSHCDVSLGMLYQNKSALFLDLSQQHRKVQSCLVFLSGFQSLHHSDLKIQLMFVFPIYLSHNYDAADHTSCLTTLNSVFKVDLIGTECVPNRLPSRKLNQPAASHVHHATESILDHSCQHNL